MDGQIDKSGFGGEGRGLDTDEWSVRQTSKWTFSWVGRKYYGVTLDAQTAGQTGRPNY